MERADAAARTMEEAARVREEALVRLKAQAANTEAQIMATAAGRWKSRSVCDKKRWTYTFRLCVWRPRKFNGRWH